MQFIQKPVAAAIHADAWEFYAGFVPPGEKRAASFPRTGCRKGEERRGLSVSVSVGVRVSVKGWEWSVGEGEEGDREGR
jgi:hypothetical protein